MKLTSALVKKVAASIKGKEPAGFTGVHTDSRQKVTDSLFIPLAGERFDGHEFLSSAINNGATASLWQKKRQVPANIPDDFPLYLVDDTLQALQDLAAGYLKEVKPIVVGITGSNGKTSTKDIVTAVLANKYNTFKTQGNFNNHIGLPLTILAMPRHCELLVLEMGMSGLGEISLLSKIAKPNYAIVTNIGESHIEQLGSREGIAQAKMEIIDGLASSGKVFLDGDEPLLQGFMNKQTITCGYGPTNTVQISSYTGDEFGFHFSLNQDEMEYFVPLLGKHNVKNAAYAIGLAKELGLEPKTIQSGLASVHLTGMRLEKTKGMNGSVIINDAYNASPTSMKAAIEAVKDLQGFSRKILVLGDMYELGSDEEALHRSVASVITKPISYVFTVGQKGKWIIDELERQSDNTMVVTSFNQKEEVVKELRKLLNKQTVVLFKASRGMKLETVVSALLEEERGDKQC